MTVDESRENSGRENWIVFGSAIGQAVKHGKANCGEEAFVDRSTPRLFGPGARSPGSACYEEPQLFVPDYSSRTEFHQTFDIAHVEKRFVLSQREVHWEIAEAVSKNDGCFYRSL